MTHTMTSPDDILFRPEDARRIGMAHLDHRRKNRDAAIPLGLESIDKDLNPLLPGELVTVIARPGNGKTGFMMRWARRRAQHLFDNDLQNRAVVYASTEQLVEELFAFNVAADTRVDVAQMARGEIQNGKWARMDKASKKGGARPLWFIGMSLEKRKKRPRLTVNTIIETVLHMEDQYGIKPEMVFVDYLQLLKFDGPSENKAVGMTDTLVGCKDGALATGCPWIVGVQARREVDDQALPIPGADSGQWTSGVEQFSDKMFSLVRPIKYRKPGEQFGSAVVEGHSQMLITLLKQKLGIDNKAYWAYFDPAYNHLDEIELKHALRD